MSGLACTHVLAWKPPYLTVSPGRPGWYLQTFADYEDGEGIRTEPSHDPDGDDWFAEWPRSAGASDTEFQAVHRWVAERLGWNVALQPGTALVWMPRRLLPRREPVFYVWQVA